MFAKSTLRPVAIALAMVSPVLLGMDSCQRVKLLAGQDDSAGVYKGPVDPLTRESAAERAKVLSERLELIQAR